MANFRLYGGSGYIGSCLHVRLLQMGHRVLVNDDLPSYLHQTPGSCDYCIFLAWPRKSKQDRMSDEEEEETLLNLCDAFSWAIEYHKYTLFVSSAQAGSGRYGKSKEGFENFVDQFPNAGYVRLGTVCGVSPNMRWELCLNHMILDALTTKRVRVEGPDLTRAHVWIEDVVEELIARARAQAGNGETISNFTISMKEAGELVARETNSELEIVPSSPGAVSNAVKPFTPIDPEELVYDLVNSLSNIIRS